MKPAAKEHSPGGSPGPPGECPWDARSYASRFRKTNAPAMMAITA
jgi:hypothetical protein